MATGLSVKLGLDASGFTQGMKQASEETRKYTNQVNKLKSDLPNAQKQFGQMQREVKSLAAAIGRMTDEEKKSAEGQSMIRHLRELQQEAGKLKNDIGDARAQVDYFSSDTPALDSFGEAFEFVGNAVSTVSGALALSSEQQEKLTRAVTIFTTVQSAANTVQKFQNMLQGESKVMMGITTLQHGAETVAIRLETAAKSKNIIVSKAAIVVQKMFNAVAKANPYVLLATALLGVGVALIAFVADSDDATDSMEEQKKAAERLEEQHKQMAETIGSAVAEQASSFIQLADEWKNLRTEAEKEQWIKNNISNFKKLGLAILDTATAQKVLVDQFPEVLKYMELQGQMAGIQQAKQGVWSDYYKALVEQRMQSPAQTYGPGTRYISSADDMRWMRENLVEGKDYKSTTISEYNGTTSAGTMIMRPVEVFELINKGLDKLNKYKVDQQEQANAAKSAKQLEETRKAVGVLDTEMIELSQKASDLEKSLEGKIGRNVFYNPQTEVDPYSTDKEKGTNTDKADKKSHSDAERKKKEIQDRANKQRQEYKSLEDELTQQNKKIDEQIDKLIRKGLDDKSPEIQKLLAQKKANEERIAQIAKIKDTNDKGTIEQIQTKIRQDIEQWKKEKQKLYDDTTKKITDPKAWREYETKISEGEREIDRLQKMIDGIKIDKLQELTDKAKELKDAAQEAYDKGDKELAEQRAAEWREANKALEDYKKGLEDLFNIKVDPKITYIDDQIKQLTEENTRLQYKIDFEPDFSNYDKEKARKQIAENTKNIQHYAEEKARLEHPVTVPLQTEVTEDEINDMAKGTFKTDQATIVSNRTKFQEIMQSGLTEINLGKYLTVDEKDILDAKKDIVDGARAAVSEVQELFDKGLITRDKAKEIVKAINKDIATQEIDPIKLEIEVDNGWKKAVEGTFKEMQTIDGVVNSVERLDKVLDSDANAWEKTMAVVQSAQQIYTGVMDTIGLFKQMQEVFTAAKEKDTEVTMLNVAATQMESTTDMQEATTSMQKTTSNAAESISEATKQGAKLPFPANIAAIAAGVAAVIAALAMISQFKFAEGGVVGGHSYYGDRILGRLNSGELVLNNKQQKVIDNALDHRSISYSQQNENGQVRIKGSDIYLSLKNYSKTQSKTTKNILNF